MTLRRWHEHDGIKTGIQSPGTKEGDRGNGACVSVLCLYCFAAAHSSLLLDKGRQLAQETTSKPRAAACRQRVCDASMQELGHIPDSVFVDHNHHFRLPTSRMANRPLEPHPLRCTHLTQLYQHVTTVTPRCRCCVRCRQRKPTRRKSILFSTTVKWSFDHAPGTPRATLRHDTQPTHLGRVEDVAAHHALEKRHHDPSYRSLGLAGSSSLRRKRARPQRRSLALILHEHDAMPK